MNQFIKKSAFLLALPIVILANSCNKASATLLTKVKSVSNPTFGNVDFEVSSNDFVKAGFDYDDLIDVTIKDYDGQGHDATFHTAFVKSFNETGYFAPCLCNYEGTKEYFELNFAIDPLKNISSTFIGKDVEFRVTKKAGYKKKRELVNVSKKLTYEELGGDNSSFANFRDVAISGAVYRTIIPQKLYRGSSPFNFNDNPDDRNKFADDLMKFYDIENEISLSCSLEDINDKYMKYLDDTSLTYEKWTKSYEYNEASKKIEPIGEPKNRVFCSVNLGTDFFNIEKEGVDGCAVRDVLQYMVERINNGGENFKFYIHCNEGKDRTAFLIMLLEALAGVPLKDIVLDYMMTFKNYYNVSVVNNKEKYDTLAELGIYRYLYSILINDPLVNLPKVDWYTFSATETVKDKVNKDPDALRKGAIQYLKKVIKFDQTEDEDKINTLIKWLTGEEQQK
ncbi:MAG: tyrosine-protein phosphatase [Bacilli bacterium]|nr:tyrosine-protein phosphatase [Bacilli bacterium]